MTSEENPLDYFKNLTSESHDAVISLEDMEKTIKFHEDELVEEDKRVKGTDEYPNYGDDFADMVYIARRLLDHVRTQKQEIEQLRDGGDPKMMEWVFIFFIFYVFLSVWVITDMLEKILKILSEMKDKR